MNKETMIKLINQVLNWCDDKSLRTIYWFAIQFARDVQEAEQ